MLRDKGCWNKFIMYDLTTHLCHSHQEGIEGTPFTKELRKILVLGGDGT